MGDFTRFDEPARTAVMAAVQWALVNEAVRVVPEHLVLGLTGRPPDSGGGEGVRKLPMSDELLAVLDRARAAAADGPVTSAHLERALSTPPTG